jgi:pyruvate kinase
MSVPRHRRAKILATLGPSSSTRERVRELFDAGADAFRLNLSHGTHEQHAERYRNVRAVEDETGRPIAVVVDLQGPKLRVGRFEQGRVELRAGAPFRLDLDPAPGDERRVSLLHPEIFRAAEPQTELLLDDGRIRLCVSEVTEDVIETVVINGGVLSDS